MLTLSLLRHAKSSWDEPGRDDFDRPLAERGRRAVPAVGRFMARGAIAPDLILCSAALRTRETLSLLLPELTGGAHRVLYEAGLYLADAATLLRRLQSIDTDARHVMVIGHNPGLHMLALTLAGHGEAADREALARKLPTAALAVLDFDLATWTGIAAGTGRLRLFVTPRTLASE